MSTADKPRCFGFLSKSVGVKVKVERVACWKGAEGVGSCCSDSPTFMDHNNICEENI